MELLDQNLARQQAEKFSGGADNSTAEPRGFFADQFEVRDAPSSLLRVLPVYAV
jgi:hypothetical protein